MAINDSAVLVPNSGNYFTAPYVALTPEGLPADLSDPTAGEATWENVGHTSLDEILSMTSEGGEATTIGTLQNKTLKTTYSARTETINFVLQQFDAAGLKLYYGSNAGTGPDGEIRVPENPIPTTCSFLAVFTDGVEYFAIYAPKAEIYRSDDLSIADTESPASLPLGVKPVKHSTNDWTFAITPLGSV